MASIRVLLSTSTNPWFNLAVEDTIFRAMPTDQKVLFLWRNADTVVVGRAQNPWKECNTRKMEQDGITLARRQSGGGAVYHDLGNTNFTFMAGKPGYDKSVSTQIILGALRNLGIRGKATGRNDLVVEYNGEERKFSGSAYRETLDRGFHHGTLLLNADLSRLANYLNPDKKKLQTKGIASVRSRVTNLSTIDAAIDHDSICQEIQQAFFAHFGETVAPELISPEAMPDLPGFSESFKKQSSWEWNFGHSPEFMHTLVERFSWGGVEIHLDVKKAYIKNAKVFTDSLDPTALEALAEKLVGRVYKAHALTETLAELALQYPTNSNELDDMQNWLANAIS